MPRGLAPMLAISADALPPDADRYAVELKWDGMRAIVECEGGEVRIASRRRTVTRGYPELAGLGAALDGHRAVLDGEIVTFGDGGRPSFERLQHRMSVDLPSPRVVAEYPVAFLAFDVLWLDGRALLPEPYTERRAVLESLPLDGRHWQVPVAGQGGDEGEALLAASRRLGLEGVVAKRLDSPYEPGMRSRCWLKVKTRRRQELVVGGWVPGEGGRQNRIGSLLVGYYDGGVLRFGGSVGSGLAERDLRVLGERLAALHRPTSPFDVAAPRPGAVFAEPELVVEVEFTEWTEVGVLRQPVYKGLRPDKEPASVVRERQES